MAILPIISNELWSDDLTGLNLTPYKGLTGNQDEFLKISFNLRFFTYFELRNYYYVNNGLTNNSIHAPGNFDPDHISEGDTFRFIFQTNRDLTGTITAVTTDVIYFDADSQWNLNSGSQTGDNKLYITSRLKDIEYSFGLYQDSPNQLSFLDGSTQTYRATGMDNVGDIVNGVPNGLNWANGSLNVEYLGTTNSPLSKSGSWTDLGQDFLVTHIFSAQTYSEALRESILSRSQPFEYKGNNTYNYSAQFKFFPDINEPNGVKTGEYDSKGNLGWYDQVFNGGVSNKKIQNLEIRRGVNNEVIEGLTASESCSIYFEITNCTASSEIVLRHKMLAFSSDYESNRTYEDIFKIETVKVVDNSGVNSGAFTNAEINLNGTTLEVTADFNLNEFALNEDSYLLSVSVQDDEFNRINLTVDARQYVSGFDIEGLIGNPTHDLFLRDCTDFSIVGATHFEMIKQELIMTKLVFPVLDGEIVSLDIQTVASDNNGIYTIDSESLNIDEITTINGVQEIDKTFLNPYNSPINNGSFKHLGAKVYELIYPFRMPYDDTRSVQGLPNYVYDNQKPNDGFNEDTYWLQTNTLDIHIAFRIGMLKDGITTFYRYKTPVIIIKDYEQNLQ